MIVLRLILFIFYTFGVVIILFKTRIALVNYLGLLGSSFTDAREVLSSEEMIAGFTLKRASRSGAIFDEEKLLWLNAIYIRNCKTEDLVARLTPFLEQSGFKKEIINSEGFKRIIDLVKTDLTTLADIENHISFFFDDKYELTDEAKKFWKRYGTECRKNILPDTLPITQNSRISMLPR